MNTYAKELAKELFVRIKAEKESGRSYVQITEDLVREGYRLPSGKPPHNAQISKFMIDRGYRINTEFKKTKKIMTHGGPIHGVSVAKQIEYIMRGPFPKEIMGKLVQSLF